MYIVVAIIITLILAQFIDGRFAFLFVLVALVVIGRRLFHSQKYEKEVRELGFSPEEAAKVQEKLRNGDRDAAIQLITEIQEQHRADLLAKGIDTKAMTPEIGREIKWSDIVCHVFRVLEFDRAGTIIGPDNTVKALSPSMPYGYLIVESPILSQTARLPIVHHDDFLLAASVFDEPKLLDAITKEELLVTYAPKDKTPEGLAGTSHALHYVLIPRGTMDRYYNIENDTHMTNPAPEKIFGTLVWEGAIKVQVNPNPKI